MASCISVTACSVPQERETWLLSSSLSATLTQISWLFVPKAGLNITEFADKSLPVQPSRRTHPILAVKFYQGQEAGGSAWRGKHVNSPKFYLPTS